MASEALRRLAARVADLSIFAGPLGPVDKDESQNAAGPAAQPVPPPDLAWLSPQAHTVFDGSPGGVVTIRTRQPDKSWSAPKPLSQHNVILFPSDRIKPASAALGREPQDNGAVRARRPPSWSDPRDEPQPGDACICCDGGTWWTEDAAPRGWRCGPCHPPPGPHAHATSDTGLRWVET
jgi:hypothetical protein